MLLRVIIACILFSVSTAQAQQKYWVFLKDKTAEGFDPYSFFDKKAIDRRIKNHVGLYEYSDLPVNAEYVALVKSHVDSVSAISRWFNAMVVFATEEEINEVSKLSCVSTVEAASPLTVLISEAEGNKLEKKQLALLDYQTKVLGREDLEKAGLSGKGIRVAILDAGFSDADKNPSFDHLRKSNQILKTYDFIRRKEYVYAHSDHGTMVLSCVAGIYEGKKIGLATDAEFILARTEHNYREPYSEEEHWVEAAEWADRNGADIISSSLGYGEKRYTWKDLNGKTSIVSRAATLAARKGILVVTSAGNEGSASWKKLGVPADADSVLTVGGSDPLTSMHISFSSYGPTADGRLKPNVCAPGKVIAAKDKSFNTVEGTSFSTPLMSGYAACMLQKDTMLTCQQLLHMIERSGRLYPYYDYAHGYGIPRAGHLLGDSVKQSPTFKTDIQDGKISVLIDKSYLSNDASDLLYYHIRDKSGKILQYYVVRMKDDTLYLNALLSADKVVAIHFKGFTKEIVSP
jgi:serine protease AprX